MKRCLCGCSQFAAKQKQLWSVTVEFSEEGGMEGKFDNYVENEKRPEGPFVCVECGTSYKTEADIPDDDEEDDI